MNLDDKVLAEARKTIADLESFLEEILQKESKTHSVNHNEKYTESEFTNEAEFLVTIYKKPGMRASKKFIYGDYILVLTAIFSLLNDIFDKLPIENKTIKEAVAKIFNELSDGNNEEER